MEVTQENFTTLLPEITKAIENCTFLSIDCELTGLKTALNQVNSFDTPEQYYSKVLKDCKEFLTIQYGITVFRFDEAKDAFRHKSFNFYIFRRPLNKNLPDQRFLCQTSSIDFLINHNFDFNKLFKMGISYLNENEEETYRSILEEQQKKSVDFIRSQQSGNCDNIIPVPDEHEAFIEDIVTQLNTFLENDDSEFQLPKCNAFLRKLIYQTNSQRFADKIQLETREVDKERRMFATKQKSEHDKIELEQKKYESLVEQLENYVGFSKVVRIIVKSGKLVVGHNMLLDFLHTIDKFLTPLPNDYLEFKECANSLFTNVLDTKYISSSEPFKDKVTSTILGQLLETVQKQPFELPKFECEQDGQSYHLNDTRDHEAGYDSFITGLIFSALWKYLGTQHSLSNNDIFSSTGIRLLKPYMNKIFLMMLTDGQYLHLAGEDLNPSREHVFYLTFPKEWTTSNIVQLFSPFGSVHISWLTDNSAYVGLYKREQAGVAFKTLSQSSVYTIIPYARRQALLAGKPPILPSPIKRRKSSDLPSLKRRKTNSLDSNSSHSKRSIDRINEEEQAECEEESDSNSKTFAECDTWD
ncbi:poly(A)-specific ribonuclease PARN-like [Anthonomus grandis grandis]|uniref:poly(A)-specific ribonuclease PARN-like n=1 Tax=Anthonomus grandis grandis TaxID=2921223 RepID=UPI0021665C49|nr:poly(A)-specific ribonuclease PARN-like [Anthonomus grandis grandis]